MSEVKWFDLSVPQHTPQGRVVAILYYGHIIRDLLISEEYYGYPHNGGRHTLLLFLTREDLEAFFDLIQPIFDDVPHDLYLNGVDILREMTR